MEKETEQEKFVLRRKAKRIGEAKVVEYPPVILLTKKSLQEEGQKKDKPIEIDEDKEDAEKEAKKDDKGKEKALEEGQTMVQHKVGTHELACSKPLTGKGGGRRRERGR